MSDSMANNLISNQALDKLLDAHDGDLALLYLFIRRTGCRDLEQAAGRLFKTLKAMEEAEEKLLRMGLLDEADPAPVVSKPVVLEPVREFPEYTSREIVLRAKEDPQFSVIVSEASKVMGHSLSGNDLKILFGIYDFLALPTEIILTLLNYCAELFYEKYQDSRRPSAKAIEKEALVWEKLEILSLDQAEEYIKRQKERRSGVGRIKALLGISGRQLSADERKTFEAWLEMGFEDEALSIAYDRTTANTGGFRLRYMNRILENWHKAGIHTAQDVALKDSPRGASPAPAADNTTVDMDELNSILEKIKAGGK